ncbi:catechol O-methyltransferase A [Latimeria chalumnae]|uniref:Catechol O-methyltransferase n=1 Tax=Latimeria chalumnae TaxID=7897 RepID=H2ZWG7_LATCH|nr:PREDICTED: catechol O-methyltransferase-like [Latimeria chalumnae]XP_006013445.1 PREDICTED: catechol O-methyltransferase-like [Latimeria chalumnae]|eukprot:XP_006013444.1 PREDICTED: catechol O-methyltransferase-like [Latimeria chalumnae]
MSLWLYLPCAAAAVYFTVTFLIPFLARRNATLTILWHDWIDEKLRNWLTGSSRPERILKYMQKAAVRGNAESVVNAIDEFCNKQEWAMNVGDEKGLILDRVVSEAGPHTVLELGTYCGYSTVRIARLLKPGARVYSVEFNPSYAKVANQIIDFAGVGDRVEVLEGSSADLIPELKKKFDIDTFDLVFIDHWKEYYLPDTKLLEAFGLLRKGTVLLADNVVFPGAPEYLAYIRNSPRYRSEYYQSYLEYTRVEDGLEKSVFLG